MTAPIVLQQQGAGQAFQQSFQPLLAALAQRKAFGLEKQKIQIERDKADAQIAEGGVRSAGLQQQLDEREAAALAGDEATTLFMDIISAPGGFDDTENVNAIRIKAIKEGDSGRAQERLSALEGMITTFQTARTARAGGTKAEVDARVASATEAVVIESAGASLRAINAGADASVANTRRLNIEGDNALVDGRIAQLQLDRDPTRVLAAERLWQNGQVTWGEARKSAGLAAGGIPDDEVFSPLTGAASGANEAANKAANFARQMITANATINSIIDPAQGVGVSIPASFMRSADNVIVDIVANMFLKNDPDQQRLVPAFRGFANAFRFFVSGQQSSDREFVRMMNQVSEQVGDSPEVIADKRVMRQIMINGALQAAAGVVSPVQLIDDIISQVEAEGISMTGQSGESLRNYLQSQRADAVQKMLDQAEGIANPGISFEPVRPDTLLTTRGRSLDQINRLTDSIGGARSNSLRVLR